MSWEEEWDDNESCPCNGCCYNYGDFCHWGHDDRYMNCEVCLDYSDNTLDDDDYDDEEDDYERDMREGGEDLVDYYND